MLLALAGLGLSGCKTNNEPENEASVPWNSPKSSWESGLPMGMGQDRR
jgi:hypothetical protein